MRKENTELLTPDTLIEKERKVKEKTKQQQKNIVRNFNEANGNKRITNKTSIGVLNFCFLSFRKKENQSKIMRNN